MMIEDSEIEYYDVNNSNDLINESEVRLNDSESTQTEILN